MRRALRGQDPAGRASKVNPIIGVALRKGGLSRLGFGHLSERSRGPRSPNRHRRRSLEGLGADRNLQGALVRLCGPHVGPTVEIDEERLSVWAEAAPGELERVPEVPREIEELAGR